jgi:membrane protease YdiL (CAAX protease family)
VAPSEARRLFLLALTAALLFVPLFVLRRIGPLDFWWLMSLDLILLLFLSFLGVRRFGRILLADLRDGLARKILLGILSAFVLYGFFYAGKALSSAFLPFAGEGIRRIYGFRGEASTLRIVLLMIFVIGPGEEIFWRASLQRLFMDRWGDRLGWFISAALYSLVHLGSGNLILVLAAAACGLFWGWLYRRYRSIILVAVSHTIWDILVFVVFRF